MATRTNEEAELEESGSKPKIIKTVHEKDDSKRLIVILENASLETLKVCVKILCMAILNFTLAILSQCMSVTVS